VGFDGLTNLGRGDGAFRVTFMRRGGALVRRLKSIGRMATLLFEKPPSYGLQGVISGPLKCFPVAVFLNRFFQSMRLVAFLSALALALAFISSACLSFLSFLSSSLLTRFCCFLVRFPNCGSPGWGKTMVGLRGS